MSVSVQTAQSAAPTAVPPLPLAELVHPDVLAGIDRLAAEYRTARPYPHIMIDNFLRPEMADRLGDGFPKLEEMSKVFREPMSYKGQLSDIDGKWPAFSPVFATLQSDAFRGLVGRISGIDGLLPDAMLAGGGLHQSPRSGFLDLHVDANMHPFDKTLHRRVNILIYVQRGWQESWGGQLELWSDRNNKPYEKIRAVVPAFNRAVIFSTDTHKLARRGGGELPGRLQPQVTRPLLLHDGPAQGGDLPGQLGDLDEPHDALETRAVPGDELRHRAAETVRPLSPPPRLLRRREKVRPGALPLDPGKGLAPCIPLLWAGTARSAYVPFETVR